MKKGILVFVFAMIVAGSCFGWERLYGSGVCARQGIVACDDGGFIIVGRSAGFNVFKINSNGYILWTEDYTDWGMFSCIESSLDGNYILSGWSGPAGARFMVFKIDSNGQSVWCRDSYPVPSEYSFANAITRMADGGFAICGEANSPIPPYYDSSIIKMFVVKTDSMGNHEWTFYDTTAGSGIGYGIVSTPDSGCISVGKNWGMMVKFDKSGDVDWIRWPSTCTTDARDIIRTFDDNYVITGIFGSRIYISKISEFGDSIWTKIYCDPPISGHGYSVVQTPDSGFAVAGWISENGGDAFLLKLDSNGDSLWMRTYGGVGGDCAFDLLQTPEGYFYLAGSSNSFGARQYYVIKTDSLGDTSVTETPAIQPYLFSLSAYPNPFNSAVTISFDTPVGAGLRPARVEIFDLTGRHVAQLPSPSIPLPKGEGGNSFSLWEKVSEGRMRAEFIWQPAASLGSGVYLVRAKFGDENITKRVVYLK